MRETASSDRAGSSPFDSLIDDGTQAAAAPPPQSPPPADKTATQPGAADQPPAKSKDTEPAQPNGNVKATKITDAANAANAAGAEVETETAVANADIPGDGKVKG